MWYTTLNRQRYGALFYGGPTGLYHEIADVMEGSIAQELGLEPGDFLCAIDGAPVADVLDYRFRTAVSNLRLCFRSPAGQEMDVEVEKDEDEDLGLAFCDELMMRRRSCANDCVFCFVDQLPSGVRPSLRYKDDDWRLSFLQGNFVTLTNVGQADLERIVAQRISPLNISVHTTDPALRCTMMGSSRAGNLMEQLRFLKDGGIRFAAQIVLCPGYNDGEALTRTLRDLYALRPHLSAVAIVPLGMTAHRDNLPTLRPLTKEDARDVIERVSAVNGEEPWVFLADEWYLLAEQPLPPYEHYGDFAQLEDGVGMLRHLIHSFQEALSEETPQALGHRLTLATGEAAYGTMAKLCAQASERLGIDCRVVAVPNAFFGGGVNVAGLLTGRCFVQALKGKPLGDSLLIPGDCLRQGEDVLLDDMTLSALEEALGVPILPVDNEGECLLWAMKRGNDHD